MPFDFRFIRTWVALGALGTGALTIFLATMMLLPGGGFDGPTEYAIGLVIFGIVLWILGMALWPKAWWRG